MKNLRYTLISFCISFSLVHAESFNPLIPDNIADPSVSKFGDTYYLYATTDIDKDLTQAGPPVVWKSKDFVNWSFEGSLMSGIDWNKGYHYTDSKGNTKTGYFRYWAPGRVIEKEGKYYLFPTIVSPDGKERTYVMIAEKPDGPFRFAEGEGVFFGEEAIGKKETKPLIDDIDGEPFVDDDGQAYIYWRRRNASRLSSDFSSLVGNAVQIPTLRKGYSEGPVLFKRKGKYYYIYTLRGRENYHNAYMLSNEGPLSGFVDPGGQDIFICSNLNTDVWGPGHGNVFYDELSDTYVFLYLEYGEGGTTRQVFANRMTFDADGKIMPIIPDRKGVGALQTLSGTRIDLAGSAKVSASSEKTAKRVGVSIETKPYRPDLGKASEQKAVRIFDYSAMNAIDGTNGTRWMADENDADPWFLVDFGKETVVSSCEMAFVFPALGHAWCLEASDDGVHWRKVAELKERQARSPHIAKGIGTCRYLRVKVLEGVAGLWKLNVY